MLLLKVIILQVDSSKIYKGGVSLSDFSDIAQVIIAAANLFLAGYVIFYQIKRDKKSDSSTALLNEQNIKLQWFKELIVQPNIEGINNFYQNLSLLRNRITTNDISIEQKETINDIVKAELSIIRKSFVDVLIQIDKKFGDKIMANLDELVDNITNAIFNDELKLAMPSVYEKEIGAKIAYSKNNLLSLLYNYKGVPL